MSLNGSGVAVINSAGQPVVASTLITATAFNALTADLATMISTAVMKDGQQTITQNIPFNSKKITGLGAGTARTDAASLATIQDGTGVYVATVGGTADAITLTPSPAITAYVAGQRFSFIAANDNTGDATVAISGLTAKQIVKIGSGGQTILGAGDIKVLGLITLIYDGTHFNLVHANHPQEITWVPDVGGTATYTVQSGRAWKSGPLVHITCNLQINVIGTGSPSLISGLPRAIYGIGTGAVVFSGLAINMVNVVAETVNTTDIRLLSSAAAGAALGTNAILGNGSVVTFSMTYMTLAA